MAVGQEGNAKDMPLTVCRCCGGKMEPAEGRGNPNICPKCERLLEDESSGDLVRALSLGPKGFNAYQADRPENLPDAEPQHKRLGVTAEPAAK